MFIVKTICCNFYPLIQLVYLSIKMLTDVTLFRMAPPTRQNPDRNEGSQANPPPPPPPPEAWQAIMAATNANAQMILQLLQERTQGQGNQGQATISFTLLLSTSFSQISPSLSATVPRPRMPMIGSWTSTSILNVAMSGLRTMSSSLLSSSRTKLLIGINNTKIPEEVV